MVLLHFQLLHRGSILEASSSLLELILEAFWSLWGHFGRPGPLSWSVLGLQKVHRKKHPKFVANRVRKALRSAAEVKPAWGVIPLRDYKGSTEGPGT